jgi:hypothetical protein
MAEFLPGDSDICFTCPNMQSCTDTRELPPCVKRVEVIKPSHNTGSTKLADALDEVLIALRKGEVRKARDLVAFQIGQLRASACAAAPLCMGCCTDDIRKGCGLIVSA